ncbi:MAG: DinB family protein [Anaerolineales bacterium]|nr:DinB family protein [Anaerolineales bacterium]
MTTTPLSKAVSDFTAFALSLSETDLNRDWDWHGYEEGVRFACFRVYEELRTLAVQLQSERVAKGDPVTAAQHILAQFHLAFRDLQAVLLRVSDADLDREPAPEEWPLRKILGHILQSIAYFHVHVERALERSRAGLDQLVDFTDEEWEQVFNPIKADVEQALASKQVAGMWANFEQFEQRVLAGCADIRAAELDMPVILWEEVNFPMRFRLHRFDSHMRQHTIQAEKTLTALLGPPPETQRLLRLIYQSLAEVEGVLIGSPDTGLELRAATAKQIAGYLGEVKQVMEG